MDTDWHTISLREKCPNKEFFLVREGTDQKKLLIWTFFTQYMLLGSSTGNAF